MRDNERGMVLVIVLVAIVVLLPLTLLMTSLTISWQKQSIQYRESISQEYAAQAGLAELAQRLSGSGIDLEVEQSTTFQIDPVGEIGRHPPKIRITRLPDAVLSVDGSILTAPSEDLDLDETGIDSDGRVFYRYRKLEIYLAEIVVAVGAGRRGVRLYGVLARVGDEVKLLGVDSERGFFGSPDG